MQFHRTIAAFSFYWGLLALFAASPTNACTTFCLSKEESGAHLFAANYDWDIGDGLLVVNKRGVGKLAAKETNPHRWKSKYGSVTFNQYGVEFPTCGMNEAGLVIGTMWLDSTKYPPADTRPTMVELQWIQYQLDTKATVAELVSDIAEVRIEPVSEAIGIHHLISDATGDSAVFESVDGEYRIYRGVRLPTPALTNDTYPDSVRAALQAQTLPQGKIDSLSRFILAATAANGFGPSNSNISSVGVEQAFQALSEVQDPSRTQWSIVFDSIAKRIHWKTQDHNTERHVELGNFDFGCGSPRLMLDVQHEATEEAKEGGEMSGHFSEFTVEWNTKKIMKAFRGTSRGGLDQIPDEALKALGAYPAMFPCLNNN